MNEQLSRDSGHGGSSIGQAPGEASLRAGIAGPDTIRDGNALGANASCLEAMLALTRMTEQSTTEIADFALTAAVRITESTTGYLAFTSEDESMMTMYAWSRSAMEECRIADKPLNYSTVTAGLWGEAIRQRRAMITNDYAAPNPLKRGQPEGHVKITRHMNVPVFQGEHIVALAGVGNKAADYTEQDVRQLTLLMQEMWNLILRKRDQERLREREEHYRLLFESSIIGFVLHGPEGIVDCNEHICRMMKISRETLMGRTPVDFSPPVQPDGRDSASTARAFMDAALGGTPQKFYWRLIRGDGQEIDVSIGLKAIGVDGRTMVMAAVEDITERRRAEEERRKLETQMQHTQKLESLGVLAGGIAHDFNNMLMAILGNTDLALLQLPENAPTRPMLLEIERASRRAAELCRQMLAYSGKGKFVVRRVDLTHEVEEMMSMLEVSISKKARLHAHFTPALPAIAVDVTQLRQVIMNLIVNASEALEERNGTITLATGMLECDREYLIHTALSEQMEEGRYVFLEVSDDGCGMDEATRARIFDPFFTTKFTGRGLGLAAVLGIVRGHKGAIKVYSEPGRGTTFKVLFPALAAATESPAVTETQSAWRCQGTVLLVDDEAVIRTVCTQMLNSLGLDVLVAEDGHEALRIYREHKGRIDCVILDLTMPRMDGEETFRELRRLDPTMRVIVSSGYTEQDVTQRFLGKGLTGFIQKPFRLVNLTEELKKIFPAGSE